MLHAQHAATPESGVQYLVTAGERACMRGCGMSRSRSAARLEHNDRFGKGNLTSSRQKGARIADRLHIEHDALCMGIIAEIIDQIAPANVEHGADRDKSAEANMLPPT